MLNKVVNNHDLEQGSPPDGCRTWFRHQQGLGGRMSKTGISTRTDSARGGAARAVSDAWQGNARDGPVS
jgi:hypothetical protein